MSETINKLLKELHDKYNKANLDDRLRMSYEHGRREGLYEAIELLLARKKKTKTR